MEDGLKMKLSSLSNSSFKDESLLIDYICGEEVHLKILAGEGEDGDLFCIEFRLHKDCAIELAKHFNLSAEDLE